MVIEDLVSVVIPVHNRPVLLRRAVASALAQEGVRLEVIVVDDGSDDATPASIAALAARHPEVLRPIRRDRPGGPGAAREAGRRLVRGEFVQYLDSDDVLAPGKLRRQIDALHADPTSDICYGRDQSERRCRDGTVVIVPQAVPVLERLFPALFGGRPWYTFNPLYRRSIVDRVGPWRSLWFSEDIEYDARMASAGARLRYVDAPTGTLSRTGHDHLSGGTPSRRALIGWTAARESILESARATGVPLAGEAFDEFRRSMLSVARQCGAAGLVRHSERLFELAQTTSPRPDAPALRLYRTIADGFGWRAAGVLARCIDRARFVARRSLT